MKLILFILFIFPFQLISQNLVKNPGFEIDDQKCVEYIGNFGTQTKDWSAPTSGTSDIFNACSKGRTGIPFNFIGHQETKYGERYAGCFFMAGKNYREYIQGQFISTLEEGKEYKISFYVSLAENSGLAIKSIGVLLTEKSFNFGTSGSISERLMKRSKVKHFTFYDIESDGFYDDKNGWMLVSLKFTATGKEKFLTIGNFHNDFRTKKKLLSNSKGTDKAYYYLDMISVKPYVEQENQPIADESPAEPQMISDPKVMEIGKSYIFENIMFDFNSVKLSTPAKEQIHSIYDFLLDNERIILMVNGHTDAVGSHEYNKVLSQNRAKAVAGYLSELGLDSTRIRLDAFGKSDPLTTNKTNFGRSLNRRVEFQITGTMSGTK